MDLFDIVGPIMIGPSSSHTAGAARIGRITRLLLGRQPREARVGLHGSFQKTYLGHGTDKAVIGGLLGMDVDDIRLRNSLHLANDAGLRYSFYNISLRDAHPNTLVLDVSDGEGRQVAVQAASVGGGEIVIQLIDGLEAGFAGHENTMVITYGDAPGMIARMTGEIAAGGLNIATMKVFRRSVGGEALVVLELDSAAEDGLLRRLAALEGVFHMTYLPMKGRNRAGKGEPS